MKFSIITPSFNQLDYLKRCVASVVDQEGVSIEHVVMDGRSTDGTVEWLKTAAETHSDDSYQLSFVSEQDGGMYDALNKGLARASGEIVAWLNCDEQYLPGALDAAAKFFKVRSDVGVLNGDVLVVDQRGELLGFWKSMPLRRVYLDAGYLYNLSCAMFFRQAVLDEGVRFDASFRAVGDQEFVARLLRNGVVTGIMHRHLAAYTFSEGNLSEQDIAGTERVRLSDRAPKRTALLRPFFRILQRGERLLRGCRRQKFPLEYSLYVDAEERRQHFKSNGVSACWPGMRDKNG